jgi:hypothetical protein
MRNKEIKLALVTVFVGCFFLGSSAVIADEYYSGGVIVDIDRVVSGYLWVDDATVNLLQNAHIKSVASGWQGSLYCSSGSVLNIYGGKIDDALYITTSYNSFPESNVTVYGSQFAIDGVAIPVGTPEAFIPAKMLSGVYQDGTPFSFKVDCYAEADFYLTIKLGWIIAKPEMAVAPATMDFGQVKIGNSQTQIVTVSNTGKANMALQSVEFVEGSSAAFSIAPLVQLPVTIEPNAAIDIEVVFAPAEAATLLGVLRIAGDDNDNPSVDVSLTGVGTRPVIAVEPASLDFGQLNIGQSAVQKLTVANQGNAELIVESAMFAAGSSADFAVTAMADVPLVIEPNGLAEIEITYTASIAGTVNAVLQITSDDLAAPVTEIAVSGKAVNPIQTSLEQINAIIAFYDNAIKTKTLYGIGPGKSAKAHQNAVRTMLVCSKHLIQGKYQKLALLALYEVDKTTNGRGRPKDCLEGPAKAELNAKVKTLIKTIKGK